MATKTHRTYRKKVRKQRAKMQSLTRNQRLQEIKAFTALCFGMLSEDTHAQIAAKTGLCGGTVSRLWHADYTLRVTVGSLQALAYAAGLKLELTEGDVVVSLAR